MRKCLTDSVLPNIEQFKCFYTTCFRHQRSGCEFVKECLQSILAYCQTITLTKHDKNKGLSFVETMTRPWLFDVRGWLMSVLLWKHKAKRAATAKNRCHPDKCWQILIWIQLWTNDVLLLFVFLPCTECALGLDSDHRNIEHPSRFFTLSFHEITFSIRSQAKLV